MWIPKPGVLVTLTRKSVVVAIEGILLYQPDAKIIVARESDDFDFDLLLRGRFPDKRLFTTKAFLETVITVGPKEARDHHDKTGWILSAPVQIIATGGATPNDNKTYILTTVALDFSMSLQLSSRVRDMNGSGNPLFQHIDPDTPSSIS